MSAGRVVRVAAAVLLFALFLWLSTAGAREESVPKSALSNAPDGRLGALALLQELGFGARAWDRPPGYLPAREALCWLPRVPFELDETGETTKEHGGNELLGEDHAPAAYRRFVEGGGTLVLAHGPGVRELCDEVFALRAFDALPAPVEASLVSTEIRWPSGETFALDWPDADPFSDIAPSADVEVVSDTNGRALALRAPLGAGQLVLLAWDGFLDNERIDDRDEALLLVRLIEHFAPRATILFDEYALGRWVPESKLGIALGPRLGVLTAQLLLLISFVAWRAMWVREFPRDPRPLETASPLARAQASASLHLRARRADRLARVLRSAVLARLSDAPGAPGAPGANERESIRALCARLGWTDEQAALEERLFRPVRDEAELERLGAELESLEARASAAARRSVPALS